VLDQKKENPKVRYSVASVLGNPDLNENPHRKGKPLSLPNSVIPSEKFVAAVTAPPRRRVGNKPTEDKCGDGLFLIKPDDVKSSKNMKGQSSFLKRPSMKQVLKSYRSLTAGAVKAG